MATDNALSLLTPSSDDAAPSNVVDAAQVASTDSGDYEIPPHNAQKMQSRKLQTVFGVTADARKVLEHFLQRSDRFLTDKRYVNDFEHPYAVVGELYQDQQPTPYQPMGSEESIYDKLLQNSYKLVTTKSATGDESDYVDCQLLFGRSKPAIFDHMLSNPDTKLAISSHPPKVKSKVKAAKNAVRQASFSSSTEDYEYTENELLNRKKKSFFRWASERLQQSFRRQVKKSTATDAAADGAKVTMLNEPRHVQEFSTKSDVPLPLPPTDTCDGSVRLGYKDASSSKPSALHRDGSEKSKSNSSSTPSETISEYHSHHGIVQENQVTTQCLAPLQELEKMEGKKKKSPMLWRKCEAKEKKKESQERGKERGVFEGLLRQFRKGSAKFKRKGLEGTRKHRSCSADSRLTKENKKTQRRTAVKCSDETEYDSDSTALRVCQQVSAPAKLPIFQYECLADTLAEPTDISQSLRHNMCLEGLLLFRPQLPSRAIAPPPAEADCLLANTCTESEKAKDEQDEGTTDLRKLLIHSSSRPFSLKSEKEKDELYEKIAEQLAAIADHYQLESPQSAKSSGSPDSHSPPGEDSVSSAVAELAMPPPSVSDAGTQGSHCTGNASLPPVDSDSTAPIVAELVKNASYGRFKQLVNDNVGGGVGWQQIARMFRLTQSAVQMAGMGTAVAIQIKEMSLTYFEDRFADWIVRQGGWESMVEDTNTEQDSELD